MRKIFDYIVSFWDVTENVVVNWVILGLMAPIVFVLTYKAIGKTAFFFGYISIIMSIFHWIIRFLIYITLVYILKGMIWFISQPLILFHVKEPRFISSIILVVLLSGFAIFVKSKSKMNNKIFWP